MPGFACIVTRQRLDGAFNFPITALSPLQISHKNGPGYAICRYVTAKFEKDKVFAEDDDVLVVIDGAILNFRDLRRRLDAPDYFQTVKRLYQNNGDEFFRDFRGEFSGLLYDKRADKWLVFTNQTGMKPVFYHRLQDGFACATDLIVLNRLLRRTGWRPRLDVDAAYMLLTYGYMLEDYTLLVDVRKLTAAQYLRRHRGLTAVQRYHVFRNDSWTKDDRGTVIARLDELFRAAVAAEYDKDLEYGYRHIAHLSGGLDSRMNVFVARDLGYAGILNLTFSQSDFPDETIAKRMAADMGNEFVFYSLDNGNYLTNTLEEVIQANGGIALYCGAAHALSAYRCLDFGPFGCLHSGQIGDAVLGSFLSAPAHRPPEWSAGAYSPYLLDRISTVVRRSHQAHRNEELFKFHNQAFNGAVNGNWIGNQYTEVCSPFLHFELLEYALTIPPALRYHRRVYEDWIMAKHHRAAKYARATTGMKPGAPHQLVKARQAARGVWRRLRGEWRTCSMNPFGYWYKTNPSLPAYVVKYVDRNIDRLGRHPELQKDCQAIVREQPPIAKMQVLTLLEAVQQHGLETREATAEM